MDSLDRFWEFSGPPVHGGRWPPRRVKIGRPGASHNRIRLTGTRGHPMTDPHYNILMHLPARGTKIAACCVLAAALLLAQTDWKTVDNLSGVDFSGLSPVKTQIGRASCRERV